MIKPKFTLIKFYKFIKTKTKINSKIHPNKNWLDQFFEFNIF
jgi:hypothetical protein